MPDKPANQQKPVASPICLTCQRKAVRCGLCGSCYQAAYRIIQSRRMSRKQMERLGLILPPQPKRRCKGAWLQRAEQVLGEPLFPPKRNRGRKTKD